MTTTTITRADDVAAHVLTAWRLALESRRSTPTPRRVVWASQRRECLRRSVLEMTVPDQQPPFDADTIQRMQRGSDRERDLLADLVKVGRNADPPFHVTNQQHRFELHDRQHRVAIVGKIDAFIDVDGVHVPTEVKTWGPWIVGRIQSFDDVFASPWTRSGGYQLLAYLLGVNQPYGLMLLDQPGIPKLLPVELDPYLDGEPEECTTRCPFYGATCNPPLASPGGLSVITDPDLEAALDRREELRKPGKAFAELDQEIKQRLRGVRHAIIGKFEIRGVWGKQSRVDLPRDLKEKYTRVDPEGRFTLTITKHG